MYWQGKEEDIVPQMQMALQHFDVQLPDGAIRIQRVKDEDWNAQWAASVTPPSCRAPHWHSPQLGG